MNFSYSKKNMINCYEGCAIGNFFDKKRGLVFFNKNILRCYTLNEENKPVFLSEHFLLENILQLETYTIDSVTDGLIILFESAKMCSVFFVYNAPVINSLKFFDQDSYDILNQDEKFLRIGKEIGFVKISKRFFSIFSLSDNNFLAKVFKFTDINEKIFNVVDLVFLSNYVVPTFCVIFNATPRSYINLNVMQALICSYDIKLNSFYVLDDFEIPRYTKKVVYSDDTLLFLSSNEIFIKNKHNDLILALNKMSTYPHREHLENIIIIDPKVFFENDRLLIFNGDGTIFNFYIIKDSGRIIDIILEDREKLTIPKFLYFKDNLLFLGSNEDSFLFLLCHSTIRLDKADEEGNFSKLTSIISKEYKYLYGETIDFCEQKKFCLEMLYKLSGIGYINDFCVKSNNQYIACSEGVSNCILEFSNFLNYDVRKVVDCVNFEKILCIDGNFYIKDNNKNIIIIKSKAKRLILNESNDLKDDKDFEITNLSDDSDGFLNELSFALLCFENNNSIFLVQKNKILTFENNICTKTENFISDIVKVKIYTYNGFVLLGFLDKENNFFLRNLHSTFEQIFENASSFCFYENLCVLSVENNLIFYNFETQQNQWIINDITNLNLQYHMDTLDYTKKRSIFYKIIEIEIFKLQNVYWLFLINELGHFAIYKINKNILIKMLVDENIIFDCQTNIKFFIKIRNYIYLNSRSPYFTFINDRLEIYFYRSLHNIRDCSFVDDSCYILTDNIFGKISIPEIKKNICKVNTNLLKNLTLSDDVIYDKYIFKRMNIYKSPKSIEISGKYILVVSSIKTKFKDNSEDENQLEVFTQKYSIDLYTSAYKFISTFDLESDEYVLDIKELSLNDSIGINGKNNFIVICVTKVEGEDKHSRGRIIVFELIDIIVDKANVHKDKKLKVLASENIKGCITKCDEIKGNLIVALGIKTMIYKIDRSEGLIPIGIHDLYTLTTSMITIKNFVLFSDIYRGLSFFYYQNKPVRFNLVCTSESIKNAVHVDFIVKEPALGIICTDFAGNIHTYTYSPVNILSCNGTKFVKRCETNFNLGKLVIKRAHSKLLNPVFISDSNYIIELDSLSLDNYNNFLKVQNAYLSLIEDTFGLCPENFNNCEYHLKPPSVKKPILKELLFRFLHLPVDKKANFLKEEDLIFKSITS